MSIGALGGGVLFLLELGLSRIALGHWVPFAPEHVAWYVGLGAILGAAVRLAWRLRDPTATPSRGLVFALCLASMQVPALVERVASVARGCVPSTPGLVGILVLLVAAYVAGGLSLHWLSRRPAPWIAPLLLAIAVQLGLVINRHLYESFMDPGALVADAVVAGSVLLVVLLLRFRTGRRPPGLGALVGAATSCALILMTAPWLGAAPVPSGGASDPRPHVVLLVIDCLRADVFEEVLRDTDEGRELDAAMAGSRWFGRAISAAPWTVPSMGSLMTGLYPEEHGFARDAQSARFDVHDLADGTPLLAEEFARRGYRTRAWVTNDFLRSATGMGRGFDEFDLLRGATWQLPLLAAGVWAGLVAPETYMQAEHVRARVEQEIPRLADVGEPLFLWVHLLDPHAPLLDHRDLGDDRGAPPAGELDRSYRDEVRYALRETARLIRSLDESGIGENAIVVLTADHGEMFPSDEREVRAGVAGDDRRYGHGQALYDELVRVPLGVRMPGASGPRREIEVLTSQVDIAPTLAELAGFEWPVGGDERVSLAPWLVDASPSRSVRTREAAYSGSVLFGAEQRSVRTLETKWIEYPDSDERPEAYALDLDPAERDDLFRTDPERGLELAARGAGLRDAHLSSLETAAPLASVGFDAQTAHRLQILGYVE